MIKLISLSDFTGYAAITANIDASQRLDPLIMQAQKYDLRGLLGDALFWDFINNSASSTPPYTNLLGGDTYSLGTGTITYEGLKPALIHWTMARFYSHNNVTIAPYGIVQKKDDYSQAIPPAKESQLVAQERNMAAAEGKLVIDYLNASRANFPLWKSVRKEISGSSKIRTVDPYDKLRKENGQWRMMGREW